MGTTLNQKIHEVPLDIKQAIYDSGYEAGSRDTVERIFTKLSEDLRGFVGLNYLEFLKSQCEGEVQDVR